jgi:hypothetical protein
MFTPATSLLFRKNNRRLRAGDWVEVRSPRDILATLDDQGRLDGLPFMAEMLQYCGKTFRIYKSAHKTCDTIEQYKGRSMKNALHLEGLRCDGEAHGGCQAACLLFWKDAWLKPVHGPKPMTNSAETPSEISHLNRGDRSPCGLDVLACAKLPAATEGESTEKRYRCQATDLLHATVPLKWWDPRQYVKDLTSRNVQLHDFVRYVAIALFNVVTRLHWRLRRYPYVIGLAGKETPTEVLNLQAGELVQVRSKDEIMCTLNDRKRNRGLLFDVEMVPYCGGTYRVLRRVERIINEKTGQMIHLPNVCIILEGVTCSGCLSTNRLFCPRSLYPYWHEIWLKRLATIEARPTASSVSTELQRIT